MVDVSWDEGDLPDWEDEAQKYGEAVFKEVDVAMAGIADEILQRLEEITKKRTGETAAAWTVLPDGWGTFFITNSNEPVITYLTEGTAAHFVAPVNVKALHWVDESGADRFSKGHMVRGIIGEDYEDEVLAEFDPIIDAALDMALDAADRDSAL